MAYDAGGQLLSGTLMDYGVPRADDLPWIDCVHLEYPSPRNPLGAKGLGEGGAISPPAAIANAIDDALAPLGVRLTATPALPARVRELIARAPHRSS
jgi:carbon-monoxide dehydrogenase large subunit